MANEGKTLEEISVEDEIPEKETFLNFVWNKKKKAFLGRTCASWVKIAIFYIIFYACLAGWFAGLLHAYYSTLDDRAPKWFGENSLIQGNPGMGFRPLPRLESTLIRFHQDQPGSYKPYTDHLEAFLKTYENVEKQESCTGRNETFPDVGCIVEVESLFDKLGCTKANGYGFSTGTPCIALKMNKQYKFTPNAYPSNDELREDQKEFLSANETISFKPGNVGVSCSGQNGVDKMFLDGHIEYAPEHGLEMMYFPYLNQVGYRAPLVIAKFKLPTTSKKVLIQVRCNVWAKNIDSSDDKEKRGTTHFELMID